MVKLCMDLDTDISLDIQTSISQGRSRGNQDSELRVGPSLLWGKLHGSHPHCRQHHGFQWRQNVFIRDLHHDGSLQILNDIPPRL